MGGISSRALLVRTGDLELLREKRAMKVREAQSQFPGHILGVAGPLAALRAAPSLGGCWKRKGCETHLSEARATASPSANWAGPRGGRRLSREGWERGPCHGLQSLLQAAVAPLPALGLCHARRWESHMSLFTRRGSRPAAGFCSPHPQHECINMHTPIWYLGGNAYCCSSCQPESGSQLPRATCREARELGRGRGWLWTHQRT